jgi:hypothetical protein
VRHTVARAALLRALSLDPRVIATFERVADETGLLSEAQRLAGILDEIAQRLGLASRGYLFGDRTPPGLDESTRALLLETIGTFLSGAFAVPLAHFVPLVRDELHMPWPWVAAELLLTWAVDYLLSLVYGRRIRTMYEVESTDPDLPQGRLPARIRNSDEMTSERHARWYYQTRVKKPPASIRSIVRAEGVNQSTVQQGIRSAIEELGAADPGGRE